MMEEIDEKFNRMINKVNLILVKVAEVAKEFMKNTENSPEFLISHRNKFIENIKNIIANEKDLRFREILLKQLNDYLKNLGINEFDVNELKLEPEFNEDIETLAENLHIWYLEAIKLLETNEYNQKAAIPYKSLSESQKNIDRYIAKKILQNYVK